MTNYRETVIEGYGRLVQERVAAGWDPYLLSFMFNPMSGSQESKRKLMENEVAATYTKLLTRMHRHPKSIATHQKPLWVASPDLPVGKHSKVDPQDVFINDGLHYHAVALIVPENRLGVPLDQFIKHNQHLYAGPTRYIRILHCEPLRRAADYVTEYALKSVNRGWMEHDAILVLPHARGERPTRTRWERKQAKIDGAGRRL